MKTKEQIQERIDWLLDEIDMLEAKYGTGVRPSWVSAEVGINCFWIREARKELEMLCSESPCDDWSGGIGKGQI